MKKAIYITVGTVIGVVTTVAYATWQVIRGLSEVSDWGEDDPFDWDDYDWVEPDGTTEALDDLFDDIELFDTIDPSVNPALYDVDEFLDEWTPCWVEPNPWAKPSDWLERTPEAHRAYRLPKGTQPPVQRFGAY